LVGGPEERRPLRENQAYGRIILKWIFKERDGGGMDWIELEQDRDRRWALVNTVKNLRVP
jgi:hypothetical protein